METLRKSHKWPTASRNLQVEDIVCLKGEPTAPTKWPLATVIKVHPGQDGKVQVVTVKTSKGIYKRPIVEVVPLIQEE